MPLTDEQINQQINDYKTQNGIATNPIATSQVNPDGSYNWDYQPKKSQIQPQQNQNPLSLAGNILKDTVTNTLNTYKNAAPSFVNQEGGSIIDPLLQGKQYTGESTGVQVAHNALGATGATLNTIFAPMGGLLKSLGENIAKSYAGNPTIANNPTVGNVVDAVNQASNSFDAIKKAHPELQTHLDNIENGLGIIMAAFSGEEGVKMLGGEGQGVDTPVNFSTPAQMGTDAKTLAQPLLDAPQGVLETTKGALGSATQTVKQSVGNIRDFLGDKLDPISPQAKTILEETPQDKVSQYAQQAFKALNDPREATPLETAGNKGNEALKYINDSLDRIGENKTSITKSVGKFDATDAVNKAREGLREDMPKMGLTFTEDGTLKNAPGRMPRTTSGADIKLLQETDNILKSTLNRGATLQRVDDAIDSIQEKIYKRQATIGAEPINSEVKGIIQKNVGILNSELKNIGGADYAATNEMYSNTLKLRNQLAQALGVDSKTAGSLMKKLFSPTPGNTKQLFSDVKSATGIDLAQDATLAKEVMDAVGDFKQKSLLESRNINPKSFIKNIIDKVLGKLPTPKIERIMKSGK